MMKYFNEFLGTFLLSIFILLTLITVDLGILQPFIIGTLLVGLIYADRKISGAHYNPAVTIGFLIRGRCSFQKALIYIGVQLFAGLLAGFLFHSMGQITITKQLPLLPMSIAEVIGTVILVYVILLVATAKGLQGNSYYGAVIGYTVTLCAYLFGGYGSHGCFNPAVALATLLTGLNTLNHFIAIVLSNILGGGLAAFIFLKIFPKK